MSASDVLLRASDPENFLKKVYSSQTPLRGGFPGRGIFLLFYRVLQFTGKMHTSGRGYNFYFVPVVFFRHFCRFLCLFQGIFTHLYYEMRFNCSTLR